METYIYRCSCTSQLAKFEIHEVPFTYGFAVRCPSCSKRVVVAYSHNHGGHVIGDEALRVLHGRDDVLEYENGLLFEPVTFSEKPQKSWYSWRDDVRAIVQEASESRSLRLAREKEEAKIKAADAKESQIRAQRRALIEAAEAETRYNAARWASRRARERVWQPIQGEKTYRTSRQSLLREMQNYQGYNHQLNGTI